MLLELSRRSGLGKRVFTYRAFIELCRGNGSLIDSSLRTDFSFSAFGKSMKKYPATELTPYLIEELLQSPPPEPHGWLHVIEGY